MTNRFNDLTIDELRKEVRYTVERLIGIFQRNKKEFTIYFQFLFDVTEFYGWHKDNELIFKVSTSAYDQGIWLKFYYKNKDHYISLTEDALKNLDRKKVEQEHEVLIKMVDEYWDAYYEKRQAC